MKKKTAILALICRLTAAIILLQTLYFKFSAAPESVYIFSTIGMEPVGRIGTGIGELIASVLLLLPATTWLGALFPAGLMSGALYFHLTKLGLIVMDDKGQLFIYAIVVFICSIILLYLNRNRISEFLPGNKKLQNPV